MLTQYYKKLEDNLVDLIIEEQAKLGYRKEMIRFYYPLSSLKHFFETNDEDCDTEAMQQLLADFPAYMKSKYGEVTVTHKGERFCFCLSEQASEFVYTTRDPNTFIIRLVQLLASHSASMEDVYTLFKEADGDCVIEKMDSDEFDVLIRFSAPGDPYFYCFKDEGCHIIYHRFLPEDYADFGF